MAIDKLFFTLYSGQKHPLTDRNLVTSLLPTAWLMLISPVYLPIPLNL